jgi:spore germination protein KA
VLNEAVSNEITRFSGDLMQDSHYLKQLYSYPTNIDFMLREFTTNGMEKRAALFYIPSMTDAKIIEEEINKPLGRGD